MRAALNTISTILLLFGVFDVSAAPAPADLMIRGDYVLTMNGDDALIEDGVVVVQDDHIVAVGEWARLSKSYSPARVIPGDGKIVMPGLINGHTHSSMTLFRGMVDDLDLMDWLNNYVFPMEGRFVNPEFVRIGTELACYEMIQGGTTTFVDMYFHPEVIASVLVRCGLRAIVAAPHIDMPSPGFKGWDDSFAAAQEFVRNWQGKNPRITPGFAPHAPYTVSPQHLADTAEVAEALGAPITIHLAEAPAETEFVQSNYGKTPIQHVDTTGLLDQSLIGAHMVLLNDQDISIVAAKGVGAIHDPTSNMKLGVGISPVPAMIAAGVNVGLGTDGAGSNNDLDMWEEIRLAALIHKLKSGDPTVMAAPVVLDMATRMGARAIGLGDVIGRLEAGMQADLIQVDFSLTRQAPLYNVRSHLVYVLDSQDVVTTIVAGKVLMENREVLSLDRQAIRKSVAAIRADIIQVLETGTP